MSYYSDCCACFFFYSMESTNSAVLSGWSRKHFHFLLLCMIDATIHIFYGLSLNFCIFAFSGLYYCFFPFRWMGFMGFCLELFCMLVLEESQLMSLRMSKDGDILKNTLRSLGSLIVLSKELLQRISGGFLLFSSRIEESKSLSVLIWSLIIGFSKRASQLGLFEGVRLSIIFTTLYRSSEYLLGILWNFPLITLL